MLSCLYPSCDPSFLPTAPGGDFCWESLELNSSEASFSLINLTAVIKSTSAVQYQYSGFHCSGF